MAQVSDATYSCGKCNDGWLCEDHPDQPHQHTTPAQYDPGDGRMIPYNEICGGAGIPRDKPRCPYRLGATVTPRRRRLRVRQR